MGLQIKKEPWRELGYFPELHTIVSAKCKLFHFLWRYGQIDEATKWKLICEKKLAEVDIRAIYTGENKTRLS